jgi:hypothetical protein
VSQSSLRRATGAVLLAVSSLLVLPAAPASAASAEEELAARYAPIVVVRDQPDACGPGEAYRPTSVDTVLGAGDVTLVGPDGQQISAPTAADLAARGEGWYLDLPGNPLDPGCDYERWFDAATTGSESTLYARVADDPDHPGTLALQYWFFWTYNDWNDKHEGDWEMIQLLFPADSAQAALEVEPTAIAFAQHEGSEVARWGDPKIHREGDRVAVFPAQGSHAAYYTQAQWFGRSAAAGFGCDNTLAQGVRLDPDIVLLPEQPTGEFAWLDFTGRWGEKAPSFNNGPTGPATKTQWDSPVSWQLEEGRETAVALPIVGGPSVAAFCELTEAGSLAFISLLDKPWLVIGIVLAVLLTIVVLVWRTDWFNNDDPALDRERKAGQIAVAGLDTLRKHPGAFWVPGLLVVGGVALNLLVGRLVLRARPGADLTDVNGFGDQVAGIGLALLAAFLVLPVIAFAMAVTVEVTDALAQGRPIDSRTAFRRVLVHPGGWVAALLTYVVVTLLAATWLLLPVALWLLSRWAIALPTTELEDDGVRRGLRRSAELTRGHRWRSALLGAFLVWLAFSLPAGVGAIVLLVTGWPFWVADLVSILVAAVAIPAMSVALTLLYYDLRSRARERVAA